MAVPLTLSRARIASYLSCRRRLQLQAVTPQPWPQPPPDPAAEARYARGRQFHQLLQRHFLGLPIAAAALGDDRLRAWWDAFQAADLPLPPAGDARLLPEITLTVPLGDHLLHGRFDLLLLGADGAGAPTAHIFDWKTGRPPADADLRADWQTRIYLALLAESGRALTPLPAPPLTPAQIRITYWFVADPRAPRSWQYDAAWHARNWADLTAIAARIEADLQAGGVWPLTADWDNCRRCRFQTFCGRQDAGGAAAPADAEEESAPPALRLEPDYL